ncbi:MAG: sigma-70 family RNA polymerase sigma factor [Deltaproteobacteria bacterium]|nr:sigma-70 family RNA polymerase sigma factor [Deltaproteobacteria bacterium]
MTPTDDPDVQLMLAVQRDDRSAFEMLFRKYARPLVGFARQFVGSQARAEELVQDVFLQVYRTRRQYAPRARFSTWLYRIATNMCLSEVRRGEYHGRVQSYDAALDDSERPMQWADPEAHSSEEVLLSREAAENILAVLGALPPQQRAALLLARAEGMSYEDVAESLGCSLSAVKSLIHRATVTLRERLGETR